MLDAGSRVDRDRCGSDHHDGHPGRSCGCHHRATSDLGSRRRGQGHHDLGVDRLHRRELHADRALHRLVGPVRRLDRAAEARRGPRSTASSTTSSPTGPAAGTWAGTSCRSAACRGRTWLTCWRTGLWTRTSPRPPTVWCARLRLEPAPSSPVASSRPRTARHAETWRGSAPRRVRLTGFAGERVLQRQLERLAPAPTRSC